MLRVTTEPPQAEPRTPPVLAAGLPAHPLQVGLAAERATEQMGQASRAPPACYLAGYLWVATRGLSFGRLSGLLPTAHPEFGVKDSWNYKVLTLLSMSTLITAGLEDLQIQKKLEHVAYPERRAR